MKAEDLNGLTLTLVDTIERFLEADKASIERVYGCETHFERTMDRTGLIVRCKSKPCGKDYFVLIVAAGGSGSAPYASKSETGGE